jgi:hypothetical protein
VNVVLGRYPIEIRSFLDSRDNHIYCFIPNLPDEPAIDRYQTPSSQMWENQLRMTLPAENVEACKGSASDLSGSSGLEH